MRKSLFAVLFILLASLVSAQQALNNEAVLKLIKAGLSDDLIVTTVNGTPGTYDTSADGLIALKTGGASDKVISAVLHRASMPASPPDSLPTPEPKAVSVGPATQIPSQTESPEAEVSSGSRPVGAGARVVIAPMGGFETYFAAAVREKKVPIILTLEKSSAQYIVVSTNTEWQGFVYGSGGAATWNRSGGGAAYGSSASSTRGLEASIMLIDARSKDVVWAYEVHKNSHGALIFGTFGARGQQSVAEACAKHLKEYIEKGK